MWVLRKSFAWPPAFTSGHGDASGAWAGQEGSHRRGNPGRDIPPGAVGGQTEQTHTLRTPSLACPHRLWGQWHPGPSDGLTAGSGNPAPRTGSPAAIGRAPRVAAALCPAGADPKLPDRPQPPAASLSLSPSLGFEVSPVVVLRRLPAFYYYEVGVRKRRAAAPLPARALCPLPAEPGSPHGGTRKQLITARRARLLLRWGCRASAAWLVPCSATSSFALRMCDLPLSAARDF